VQRVTVAPGDGKDDAMNAVRFGFLIAILFVGHVVEAGTGHQQTTFLVNADERTVCRWIDDNADAIDQSTGAEVLGVRGRQAKLRKETKEGTFTFVVQHDPEHAGKFRTVLVSSDKANLASQETEIQVQREGDFTRVTITVVVSVNGHTGMAISLGIRPSLRGMRKLLETQFGTPGGQ
jgi:ferric-dicitrate binding protein FerR (iron transport regulator)